LTRGASSESC